MRFSVKIDRSFVLVEQTVGSVKCIRCPPHFLLQSIDFIVKRVDHFSILVRNSRIDACDHLKISWRR